MSDKKFNSIGWKKELDNLDHLPAENGPDMGALWGKLENRLNETKPARKSRVYWLAAACSIACLLLIGIQWSHKKEMTNPPFTKNDLPVTKKLSLPANTATIKETVTVPLLKNDGTVLTASSKKSIRTINKINVNIVSPVAEAVPEPIESMSIVSSNEPGKKPDKIVFPSLRKKLPVVHINDLEKPVPGNHAIAENNNNQRIRVRLFNMELPHKEQADNQQGIINLKIKLSPQN